MGVTPDEKPPEGLAQAADVVNTEVEQDAMKSNANFENVSFDELKRQASAAAKAEKQTPAEAPAATPKKVVKKPAVKAQKAAAPKLAKPAAKKVEKPAQQKPVDETDPQNLSTQQVQEMTK